MKCSKQRPGAWEVDTWEWVCGMESAAEGWVASSKGLGRGKWIRGGGFVGWRMQLKAGAWEVDA